MKKRIFLIITVCLILSVFTISTFAQVPTDSVTGYYIEYGNGTTNQENNSTTINLLGSFDAFQFIEFFKVGDQYYFYEEELYNDGDSITYKVVGTDPLQVISIDVIDSSYSDPANVIIFWKESVIDEARNNYDDITVIEDTFVPVEESAPNGIYNGIYNLVSEYIYGTEELNTEQALVATTIATIGCIFLLALPFILVYLVIRFIGG